MSASLKLTYLQSAGRAEATRLALHIGGISFEDERLSREEIEEYKTSGKAPFLVFPLLTVDGEVYAESNAILRYAGKLSGLYPTCAKDALKVDMVIDVLETVINAVVDDDSKEGRSKFVGSVLPRYCAPLDRLYAATSGPFLFGEQLTIADLKLMIVVVGLNVAVFEHVPAGSIESYTHLMNAMGAVLKNEKVKEWNAAHPHEQ